MLLLAVLLTAIASLTAVKSNSPSEGPTTDAPLTRGVNEVSCNSTSSVFRCDESSCVSKSSVCNGVPDCPDGQDESVQQCGCLPNEFPCSDSCVDIVKRCDRKNDCPGAEDELDCKSFTCPATHFKCNNFYCIPIDLVCNFEDDCGDKSDEADCSKYRYRTFSLPKPTSFLLNLDEPPGLLPKKIIEEDK
ncbi:hypothetical protein GE061_002904 [Apolygus lucorum]|uniref:Uncharacterized protein n=1 Tax=Apolygus lucorum TaxID=248454 RepID=A0A8S9X2A9_APOLU|nr:hypothetical protein GE061_002904 [Apolygus lucorum]